MKKLAFVLVLAASALLPASAPASGCRPLDCASSSSPLGHGLFALRPQGLTGTVVVDRLDNGHLKWMLPQGVLTGHTLVHQDGATLTWYDALTGEPTGTANVHGRNGFVVGTSQDGRRAVLLYTYRGSTTLQIVTPSSQRQLTLKGTNWGFDALADSSLYLLRYEKNGYQVRRYDLARNRLVAQALKDPHESSLIWGTAWSRLTSPDGRYVFTLYLGSDGGAMVHELDVRHSTARCVELPGSGNFNLGTTYTMQLSPNGKTLWAVNPGYGRVVGIDVAGARVRTAFRFRASPGVSESPAATVSDIYGSRLAVAVGGDAWLVNTRTQRVRRLGNHPATAIAFARGGTHLWIVQGMKLVALRV